MTCTATRHGTRAAYLHGCRCPESRAANTRYQTYRERRLARAAFGADKPFSVPVEQVREVLATLQEAGWTLRGIERATGIGRDHLGRFRGRTSRPVRRVRYGTYERLAALLEDDRAKAAGGHRIDAADTWRLIHGLIALGYPKTWIAQQIGVGRAIQFGDVVTIRNARKVQELAARYSTSRGPSDAARAYAAKRGWTPDLLWQDIDTGEEIGGVIDEVAVRRAVSGDRPDTLTKHERREAVRRMHDLGESYDEMARRLGTHSRMIHRDLTALGLVGAAS